MSFAAGGHQASAHALADAGLVRSRRRGRERLWELQTERLARARRYLEEISSQWDEALERLRASVESDEG